MNNEEAYIIRRILKGDISFYDQLMHKYSQRVFTLIVRIVTNREDAEELTQDTFLKAFRNLRSFKEESCFSTWIYRIAYNTAVSAARKKKFDTFTLEENLFAAISDQQIDHALNDESEQQISRLNNALAKLTGEERALVTLFYQEDKQIGEIAQITGLSESNAKVKLHRIRKKLYILIKQQDDEYRDKR